MTIWIFVFMCQVWEELCCEEAVWGCFLLLEGSMDEERGRRAQTGDLVCWLTEESMEWRTRAERARLSTCLCPHYQLPLGELCEGRRPAAALLLLNNTERYEFYTFGACVLLRKWPDGSCPLELMLIRTIYMHLRNELHLQPVTAL